MTDQQIETMNILPCPFCGSAEVHVHLYNRPSVQCENCYALGPAAARWLKTGPDNTEQAKTEAIELWNHRADYRKMKDALELVLSQHLKHANAFELAACECVECKACRTALNLPP